MSTTIRITDEAKRRIALLADETGRPMTELLDEAIEQLERKIFFDNLNKRYAELRADPVAWAEIEAERREWDKTLRDGLD